MALLLIVVGSALSALLVPMVVTQVSSTRLVVNRVDALNAAQAGIDAALGQLRAANDGSASNTGVLSALPCTLPATTVGAGGTASYSLTINYFVLDPSGQPDSWITTNRIRCVGRPQSTPSYALLRSQGTKGPSTRTIEATYVFTTTGGNIPGGLIPIFKTTNSLDLCMDAGSGNPIAATKPTMQKCNPGSFSQTFAYNGNLTISLVASKTPSAPLGMCLDAATPHVAAAYVVFQQCAAVTQPRQQWSYNDYSRFEGTSNGTTLDGKCFNVQTPDTSGSFLVLGRCPFDAVNDGRFSPEASVGAGQAGPGTQQLVNFREFGRCLDMNNSNVNATFHIAWPCKQAPTAAGVGANQKWTVPAINSQTQVGSGKISANVGSGPYCLKSPQSTAPGQYVTTVACPAGTPPANLTWTLYGDTGTYATSYVIQDAYGNCLAPTDPDAVPPDFYDSGQKISKIVVAPCDGSMLQKWNAPPDLVQSIPLKDVVEK